MKKNIVSMMVIAGLGIVPATASAEFIPRVGLSYDMYEYGYSSSSTDESSYLAANVGGTFLVGEAMYFDVAYDTSLGAEHDRSDNSYGSDFERTSWALTFGGFVNDATSVFGGYRSGEAVFSHSGLWDGFEYTIESSGPFFGASYGIPAGDGTLSFNIAIALLDANFSNNQGVDYDSDAGAAASFGVAYKLGNLGFNMKSQSFSYDDPWGVENTEDLFSLGATYSF